MHAITSPLMASILLVACASTHLSDPVARIERLARTAAQESVPARKAAIVAELRDSVVALSSEQRAMISDAAIGDIASLAQGATSNLAACDTLVAIGPRGGVALPSVEAEVERMRALERGSLLRMGDSGLMRMERCLEQLRTVVPRDANPH